jgi:hypothetical protein
VEEPTSDQSVLDHIQELVEEEHSLQHSSAMTESDLNRLHRVQVELDQCWDLLRQRRALRGVGQDPDQAQVRPPEVVEKYEQ